MKIKLKESEFKSLIQETVKRVLTESNYYEIKDLMGKSVFTKADLSRILDAIIGSSDESHAYRLYDLKRDFGLDDEQIHSQDDYNAQVAASQPSFKAPYNG